MDKKNKTRLSNSDMSKALQKTLSAEDMINENDTAFIMYDLDFLKQRIADLQNAFPATTLHAIAAKANPLFKILQKQCDLNTGAEVASLPELYLAGAAGFNPEKIVFDSPAKTKQEIEYALKLGVCLNADSFDELDRIAAILNNIESKSVIGVRINPQIGTGSIQSTSVAGSVSKFGIPLDNNVEKLKTYYTRYDWLKSIHVHIGSQGMPVTLLIKGIKKIVDFTLDLNQQLKNQQKKEIEIFDIGGGLPVAYHENDMPVSINEYVALLKQNCSELFSNFKLITEFGRHVHANTGWIASKVEYVKKEKDHNIIMIHTGADLFLRECYNPMDWYHQISVADASGVAKKFEHPNEYMIAGPLCFAGDVIAKNISLPEVNEGDYILIHDSGAYTLSMWSRYNSRQIPKVIGYSIEESLFEILKQRETKEEVLKFWS